MKKTPQKETSTPVGFHWLEYLSLNPDIQHLDRFQAVKHWIEKGQFENRIYHMKNKIRVSDASTNKHHSTLVYSAIIGNYEEPKRPNIKLNNNTPFVLLNDTYGDGIPAHDNRHKARHVKILGYKNFLQKNTIWIDGSFILNCNPNHLLKEIDFEDYDIAVPKHRIRNNALEEAEQILRNETDYVTRGKIERQIDIYKKRGYKFDNGLAETGILVRKNTNPVNEFCDLWWKQICDHSLRDQLSFNYCLWVMEKQGKPLKVKYIDKSYWRRPIVSVIEEECPKELPKDFHYLEYEKLNADIARDNLSREEIEKHWIKWGQREGREYSLEDAKNRHFIYIPH